MRLKYFIIYSLILIVAFPFSTLAKRNQMERPTFNTSYEDVFMPKLGSNSIFVDEDEIPPNAPILAKARFVKLPEVQDIQNRVKRVVEGVTEVIPPKYDHYGYEIRRYMQSVGDARIYEDEEFLKEQIVNVRRAKVIADFWKQHLENELQSLKAELDQEPEKYLSTKTMLKRHEAEIQRFVVVLNGWITLNEKILLLIFKEPDYYSVIYPEVIISSAQDKVAMYNLMNAKQTRLKDLRLYQPFEMMAY